VNAELSLSLLEYGYQSVTFGYDEPTHLRGTQDTLNKIISMLEATPRYNEWRKRLGIQRHMFNNAVLTLAKDLPEDVVQFVNVHYVEDHRMNCWLRVGDSEWKFGSAPVTSHVQEMNNICHQSS